MRKQKLTKSTKKTKPQTCRDSTIFSIHCIKYFRHGNIVGKMEIAVPDVADVIMEALLHHIYRPKHKADLLVRVDNFEVSMKHIELPTGEMPWSNELL